MIQYVCLNSDAGVAQSVEQLIRNQQVMGSSPITSSIFYYNRNALQLQVYSYCRCSSMAELQLPKLITRVRFPSSAPKENRALCAPCSLLEQMRSQEPVLL